MVTPQLENGTPGGDSFRRLLISEAARQGLTLAEREATQLVRHCDLLRKWSRRMNLTGLRSDGEILRRHFLEPIAAADLLGDEGRLVDIGSGNGFPAIPLNVLHPGLELVLVESSEKKSTFLRTVLRELGLGRARVETRRLRKRSDLADLLPTRHLTFRAVRGRDLLRGEGTILQDGGRALAFVSQEESEALRLDPIRDLAWAGCRILPSTPGSVVVMLEPTA
jgi:16S rRNA (guanine527-N7)-methyltransferase